MIVWVLTAIEKTDNGSGVVFLKYEFVYNR